MLEPRTSELFSIPGSSVSEFGAVWSSIRGDCPGSQMPEDDPGGVFVVSLSISEDVASSGDRGECGDVASGRW